MLTAKDIMTSDVITVTPEMPVEKLAELLWQKKIGGAPVVDAGDAQPGCQGSGQVERHVDQVVLGQVAELAGDELAGLGGARVSG